MRAGWMRPSGEQALEREPRDLAAHAVEARQEHGAGRVVDDEVDPGERLERADVAALAADDPALQLVRLELDDRDRGLDGVARRHPLHHRGEDAARAPVGVAARLLLDLPDHAGAVVAQLVLELAHHDLLRLPGAEAGHALELAQLPRLLSLQLLARVVEVAPPVLERALALGELLAPGPRASSPSRAGAPPAAPARSGGRAAPPRARRARGSRARLGAPAQARARAVATPPPARASTVRGRCTSITTATATPAATSAANTISISVSSHGARGAGLNTQFR